MESLTANNSAPGPAPDLINRGGFRIAQLDGFCVILRGIAHSQGKKLFPFELPESKVIMDRYALYVKHYYEPPLTVEEITILLKSWLVRPEQFPENQTEARLSGASAPEPAPMAPPPSMPAPGRAATMVIRCVQSSCRQSLRVPINRGRGFVTCPACRNRWEFSA